MVQQGIKELSALYKDMTKKYNNIRVEYVDDVCILEKDVLKDMQAYLEEILATIPITICVHYEGRLVIEFLKNESYDTEDGRSGQADAVIIVDRNIYKNNMTLTKGGTGKKFCGMEKPSEELDLRTFEYMCSAWQDIKREIHYQVIDDLEERIKKKLEMIKKKKEYMKNLTKRKAIYEMRYGKKDKEPYSPSSAAGDYSPSHPWDAPGMSTRDFF